MNAGDTALVFLLQLCTLMNTNAESKLQRKACIQIIKYFNKDKSRNERTLNP